MKHLPALLFCFFFGFNCFAQVTTSRLEGTVTDPQGAMVPGAEIQVINPETGLVLRQVSNERGYWVIPSLPTATYQVTVTKKGFKKATVDRVKIDAGVPATVNVALVLGEMSQVVEVLGGAEVLQTATATVTSTMVGQQLHELPFTSRNLTELIVTQPGSATPGVARSTSVYGLPQSALNVSLDGINIQDNANRSSDGFFNAIFPRADSIEEMSVTSSAAGAESNAEGALQVKMVTRSGSNDWHGGVFEQHRNQLFNANYYFNNVNNQPRDHIIFNQFGGTAGGPILKDRLFFFFHMEAFQLPQTYTEPIVTLLTPEARQGLFRYKDSSGNIVTKNLFTLAAAGGFTSTPDPLLGSTLDKVATLTDGNAGIQSRIASNNDYNRNSLNFQSKGGNYRRFPSLRMDWNVTSKHHVEFIYNYQTNLREPDGVNIGTASPIYPGTGIVLGNSVLGNQGGIAFSAVTALRSTLTPRLTTEIRFGLTGGTVIFNNGITPSDFDQWNGFAPVFNFVTNPYRQTGESRRNTPLKQGNGNLTWSMGAHLWNFGGSFTQVNQWTTNVQGTQFIPGISFAMATGDPASTGTTNLFTAVNFPGSTPTVLSDAGALYALLTGRVSAVNRSVVMDEITRTYGAFPPTVRNQQRQIGLYFQDTWRMRPGLTFNYGLRWDMQRPPVNLNGVYTRPGYQGVWGISGVGNLFKPGTLTGQAPVFNIVDPGTPTFNGNFLFSPSAGLAWVIPKTDFKPLAWLIGSQGNSVIRAGYAISSIREDAGSFGIWGNNQGRTVTLNVDPTNYPAVFGAPGSVLFRNPPFPARTAPTAPSFPLAISAGNSVSDFDPDLKVGYVQSWDIGLQRQLTRNTAIEIRYVGNHGTGMWRQINLNEVNVFENGFLDEFKIAQSNLALARATNPTSTQFAGLTGQQPLPIIRLALNLNSDTTTATQIAQGQVGALANAIATNTTRMGRLTTAGYAANLFQVNPLAGGAANLMVNDVHSQYHGLQLEVRRRMASGLLVQGSYSWAHATSNYFGNGRGGNFITHRNHTYDRGPSPYDIRHALKLNWIYELPFGPKRHFLSGISNAFARKALEGWSLASVMRVQTGSPIRLQSGRATFNSGESGVVLKNMTVDQLQGMMSIRKWTNSQGLGVVSYFPQDLIDNTLAAFELVSNKTVDTTKPYIAPPRNPGEYGQFVYLYGPPQQKWDFSLVKKTNLGEKANLEFRVQALNAFNLTNFMLFSPGNNITTGLTVNSSFGQTTGAYRDLQNTNDTGGRILEFVIRINF